MTDMNVRGEIKRRRRREKRGSADGASLVYVCGILQSIETRRRRSSTSIMVVCDSEGKVGG